MVKSERGKFLQQAQQTMGSKYGYLIPIFREEILELQKQKDKILEKIRTATAPERIGDWGPGGSGDVENEVEASRVRDIANNISQRMSAIRRIEADRYGVCYDCGDPIGENRLGARPFSVKCTDCEAEGEPDRTIKGMRYKKRR